MYLIYVVVTHVSLPHKVNLHPGAVTHHLQSNDKQQHQPKLQGLLS